MSAAPAPAAGAIVPVRRRLAGGPLWLMISKISVNWRTLPVVRKKRDGVVALVHGNGLLASNLTSNHLQNKIW